MKMNIKDNYDVEVGLAPAVQTSGNGAAADLAKGSCVSFLINVGVFDTALNVKAQYSEDGATGWTDEPVPNADGKGYPGNDHLIAVDAAGAFVLDIPNPRARFYRAVASDGGVASLFGILNVVGPKRTVEPVPASLV